MTSSSVDVVDDVAGPLPALAARRLHQWRSLAVLVLSLRATVDHQLRFAIIPLVREILKML